MPDSRQHRGPHPEDQRLFAPENWPQLCAATSDYCWLLTRDYPPLAALKLVGDRYGLTQRQRLAVQRCSAADQAIADRQKRRLPLEAIGTGTLWIDGFNLLTTIEAALAGGILLAARDGCLRDMASMHGSYRRVAETQPAIESLAAYLMVRCGESHIVWWLDRPVPNSGRLRKVLLQYGAALPRAWTVELVDNADHVLRQTATPIVSADSHLLDHCGPWCNVAWDLVSEKIPSATIVRC